MSEIGRSIERIDARGKVTGETKFSGDLNFPDQVHAKILFAHRPHAVLRSIETSAAKSMPGVLDIFTAADVPVNEYGMIIPDQPVLCGLESGKTGADRVRFVGDQVALVVAENEALASQALKKIVVEYEDLPIVTDPLEAMKDGSPLLHPETGSNIFQHNKIRKGDVEKGFEAADVVVEATYRTPAQEHAYLQPEAGVGYVDDEGRVTVQVAGQSMHEDQEQIAHALNLPVEKVRVVYPAIGGAFGGREDMSIQIVLALAALRLREQGINRPVKIIWSREESILGHHKRHPFVIRAKWGATSEGKIAAAEMELIQDGGAYAYTSTKVLGNATLMCTGPYEIPNVRVDAYSVYTNNIPGGAFRGFGGPQAAFAAEGQINKIAEALSIDPVELRMKNLVREGSLLSVGTPLPTGVSIDHVVETCAQKGGWEKTSTGWQAPDQKSTQESARPHWKRGIGFSCGFKNVGFSFGFPEKCTATVELHGDAEIEEVVLHHAGADVGQGAHTVMSQMVAEAVGVPVEKVRLITSDTADTGDSGSASASRMTFMAGNSIRGAAEEALQKWRGEERPVIATYTYFAPKTTALDPETGHSDPNFSYGYVAETVTLDVDTETGHIRLLDVICADDVGKAINLQQIVGQVEGAIVQAIGYAILENFIQESGDVVTRHLSTYLIPTVLDIPDRVESVILETADPVGPWGARGMAEMPYIPLAPAVTAAVWDATGVWFDELPLTPERVLFGLRKAEDG
jgi:CO/xanthine dehydrogenase Mo-binding subunit